MPDMPARYLTVMCGMTASYLAGMLGMTAGYIAAGRMTARYLTVMLDVAAKYLTVVLVMTARYVAVMPGPLSHPPPSPQACPGATSFMEVALLSPLYLSCFCPSLPPRPPLAEALPKQYSDAAVLGAEGVPGCC